MAASACSMNSGPRLLSAGTRSARSMARKSVRSGEKLESGGPDGKTSPPLDVREERGLRRIDPAGCWPNPRRRVLCLKPREEPTTSIVSTAGEPRPSAYAGGEGSGHDDRAHTAEADAEAGSGR